MNSSTDRLMKPDHLNKSEANGSIAGLRELPADLIERVKGGAKRVSAEAAKRVDRSVHENPWRMIAFSAVGTAVAGFLLGRRSKR